MEIKIQRHLVDLGPRHHHLHGLMRILVNLQEIVLEGLLDLMGARVGDQDAAGLLVEGLHDVVEVLGADGVPDLQGDFLLVEGDGAGVEFDGLGVAMGLSVFLLDVADDEGGFARCLVPH